jgi:hypothetical protein
MDQTTRLFQIRRTCLEMLSDRDYLVAEVGHGGREAASTCSGRDDSQSGSHAAAPAAAESLSPSPPLHRGRDDIRTCVCWTPLVCAQGDLTMNFDDFRAQFAAQGSVSKEQLTLLQQHKDDPSQKVGKKMGGSTRNECVAEAFGCVWRVWRAGFSAPARCAAGEPRSAAHIRAHDWRPTDPAAAPPSPRPPPLRSSFSSPRPAKWA